MSQRCHIRINNRTSEHLRLVRKDLPWGEFTSGPAADLLPHVEAVAFWAAGASPMSGTEGTVVYQIGDDANTTVTIYFDVPFVGSTNTLRVDTSDPDVAAQVSDFKGSGEVEDCVIKVIDGRDNG